MLAAAPALAGDLHGRIELTNLGAFSKDNSLDAALGEQNRDDISGDFRLIWEPKRGRWDFDLHYELSGAAGGGVKVAREKLSILGTLPPTTLFDLTDTIADGDRYLVIHKIDRLSIGYSAPKFVVRVGRQALTWGVGIVFHPLDLIDPFAPDTIDTEYKPGTDMAYFQWLFDDGSDLQFIAAPRPEEEGGDVTEKASTFALHYQRSIGELGTMLLYARDHGDWNPAFGMSGPLKGAVWNAEVAPVFEPGGKVKTFGLANISDALTLFSRNATLFAEYYYNGFGVAGRGVAFDAL
ncbi:MAG TPA: hypothetical protein VNH64_09130, partial [Parvularculaceae bacterium]|nr:hypothetical protein [Parvularculaceae bacterium]